LRKVFRNESVLPIANRLYLKSDIRFAKMSDSRGGV
jgi:hypothetical protein